MSITNTMNTSINMSIILGMTMHTNTIMATTMMTCQPGRRRLSNREPPTQWRLHLVEIGLRRLPLAQLKTRCRSRRVKCRMDHWV
jgi:hypothetical protein